VNQIVFICGVPPLFKGILLKIFIHLPEIPVYYQPFKLNLDLFVKYSLTLRGLPAIPPGYFDSYNQYPEIFHYYPTNLEKVSFESFLPFLKACINTGSQGVVFEISGFEGWIPKLLEYYPTAKFVIFEPLSEEVTINFREINPDAKRIINKEELLHHYYESTQSILSFCEFLSFLKEELFLTSDWLKLAYVDSGLEIVEPDTIYSDHLDRSVLSKLLEQSATIVELGRLEVEVNSLKTQLNQISYAAAERLKVIEILNAEIIRLKAEI